MYFYFTKFEPIFKTNTNLTRGAHGNLKLNRTLGKYGNANEGNGNISSEFSFETNFITSVAVLFQHRFRF